MGVVTEIFIKYPGGPTRITVTDIKDAGLRIKHSTQIQIQCVGLPMIWPGWACWPKKSAIAIAGTTRTPITSATGGVIPLQ
jgi:hypothetical protein